MNTLLIAGIVWIIEPAAIAKADPQPSLAPQCVCAGPTDPNCKCGKACQCVPTKPKPAVSVMFPKQTAGTCPNGQCTQAPPKSVQAGVKAPASVSPGSAAACPSCSGVRYSQPLRRGLFGWRR